jgi:MoaA/NifB/PqqE/SkfB family radical SAM enzyme
MTNLNDLDKEINIQIINKCQLKCKFCARSWLSDRDLFSIQKIPTMSTHTFALVVNECIKAGKTRFGLTPRMGDLFLDDDIMNKLRYLEHHVEVEYFFFATNLLNVSKEDMEELLTFKKLYLEISLYGYDEKSYKDTTNKDLYQVFIENLELFKEVMGNVKYPNITLYVRWGREKPENTLKTILLELEIINTCVISYDEINNFNFGGLIPEGSLENEHPIVEKKGICPTAYTGCILPNGDYNMCYMNDVYNQMTLGNIFHTPLTEILESEVRKVVIEEMKKDTYVGICVRCNEKW